MSREIATLNSHPGRRLPPCTLTLATRLADTPDTRQILVTPLDVLPREFSIYALVLLLAVLSSEARSQGRICIANSRRRAVARRDDKG